MDIRFLGKDTNEGNSPTLWETDDGQLVIQGFILDSETLAKVGSIPDGEAVIRIPRKLLAHLKDDDAPSAL